MGVYSVNPETGQQPVVDIAKASVAENAHHITRAGTGAHMVHNGLDGRQIGGRLAGGAGIAERRDEWDLCDRKREQSDNHRAACKQHCTKP